MGKEMAKGMLQAIGGILIYILVVWVVITKYFKRSEDKNHLKTALYIKSPGMFNILQKSDSYSK